MRMRRRRKKERGEGGAITLHFFVALLLLHPLGKLPIEVEMQKSNSVSAAAKYQSVNRFWPFLVESILFDNCREQPPTSHVFQNSCVKMRPYLAAPNQPTVRRHECFHAAETGPQTRLTPVFFSAHLQI